MTSTDQLHRPSHFQKIQQVLQAFFNSWIWRLVIALAILVAGIRIGYWRYQSYSYEHWQNFLNNFETEFYGMVITLGGLYYFDKRREERRLKAELLWQIRSRVTDVAVSALDRLRANGWLNLIDKTSLGEVKWSDANLRNIDLSGALMGYSDLSQANLWSANLNRAIMGHANLSGAGLADVNLSGAFLVSTNLSGAYMVHTNLSGAEMVDANLRGAAIEDAQFDEATQLPDHAYWTAETDMTRFTNPDHPQFWRSTNPYSPAYRGDKPEA